jgi:hypothetical protein
MKKMKMWLSYDLGVSGDFEHLYSWLDDKKATECCNNCAFLEYEFPDSIVSDTQFVKKLKQELEERVEFKPGNRIYLIIQSLEEKTKGKPRGIFLIGKRKANPWEGYGTKATNVIDE